MKHDPVKVRNNGVRRRIGLTNDPQAVVLIEVDRDATRDFIQSAAHVFDEGCDSVIIDTPNNNVSLTIAVSCIGDIADAIESADIVDIAGD